MAQICTTIEQSKKLQELGVTADTADMFFPLGSSFPEVCDNEDNLQADCPARSLGALIKLMPDTIILNDRSCCGLSILNIGVYYRLLTGLDIIQGYEEDNIFENCVRMIAWLVNHGYIQSNLNKND
ncbi:hypothetical protein [Prevotella corporis]|uniref:hypothetical protein n=1 Tax=Prevotella corporis TaxID=28128 RepID=UPI0023F6F94D|nr:hypothetical protein [Prevotella corporis]